VASAGASRAGRDFAARNADCLLMAVPELDGVAERAKRYRERAALPEVEVFATGHVICRESKAEVEEYYDHIVREYRDRKAGDRLIDAAWPSSKSLPHDRLSELRERSVTSHATFPVFRRPR